MVLGGGVYGFWPKFGGGVLWVLGAAFMVLRGGRLWFYCGAFMFFGGAFMVLGGGLFKVFSGVVNGFGLLEGGWFCLSAVVWG